MIDWRSRHRLVVYAIGLAFAVFFIRLPVLLEPRPIDDEVVYVVVGNEIAAGGEIYKSAVERKPPLLLWTYAAVSALFGPYNPLALHLVATLWILATMTGVYVVGRRLFDPSTGLVGAMLYGLYQQWAFWNNLAFNGELLMNLPIVWAYALAFAPDRSRIRSASACAGALVALAFLFKQPAAVALVPLMIYPFHPAYRRRNRISLPDAMRQLLTVAAGFAGVLLLVVAFLYGRGALREAWYWTILDHDVPHLFWQNAVGKTLLFLTVCAPITLGAAWSSRQTALWAGRDPERWTLLLLAAVAAVGTASSGRFYAHYYVAIVLPLAILAAPAIAGLLRPSAIGVSPWASRLLSIGFVVTAISFLAFQWRGLSRVPDDTETGAYLRRHSAPGDRIFVWGRGTRIYLDAERRPASRYIATFPLTGRIFGSPELRVDTRARVLPGAWETLRQELLTRPPAYIVDMEAGPTAQYPVQEFPALQQRLAADYELVRETTEGKVYRRTMPPVGSLRPDR